MAKSVAAHEAFWKMYENEDILEVFDDACELFSAELAEDFVENYDVTEMILEVRGHQESAKNFDNVLRFTEILQKHQPALYQENFTYIDDFLVDYSCYTNDTALLNTAFDRFIADPLQDYDKYLMVFFKYLFYQHTSVLERAISANIETLRSDRSLMEGAEFDLAQCRLYMEMEAIYKKGADSYDRNALKTIIEQLGMHWDDATFEHFVKGVLEPQMNAQDMDALCSKKTSAFIAVMEGYFLRYMHAKGFVFYLSGKIWQQMEGYWSTNNKRKKSPETVFAIDEESFNEYLNVYASWNFNANYSEMIALLWCSVYVYEFLNQFGLISDKSFNKFIIISRKLKGDVIARYIADLWNSNFVHAWPKPDCISETEFREEEAIFRKSVAFRYEGFEALKGELSDELSRIGELSEYIMEGGKAAEKKFDTSLLDKLFSAQDGVKPVPLSEDNSANLLSVNRDKEEKRKPKSADPVFYDSSNGEPISVEKTAGRNDPCTCGSGKKYKKCCGK